MIKIILVYYKKNHTMHIFFDIVMSILNQKYYLYKYNELSDKNYKTTCFDIIY